MTFAVPEEEDCEYKVWEEGGHVHNIPRGSDTLVIIYIYYIQFVFKVMAYKPQFCCCRRTKID